MCWEGRRSRAGRPSQRVARGRRRSTSRARRRRRRASRTSHGQCSEVFVGNVREGWNAYARAALLELVTQAPEQAGELVGLVEADAGVADELRMAAAAQKRSGKPAREPFEQRVRARVVATGSKEHVVGPQQLGERLRRKRGDGPNVRESLLRVAGERDLELVAVEVPVEPRQDVDAFAWIVGPARCDHAQTLVLVTLLRRMEDGRIDRVRHDCRIAELEPELCVLLQAVTRLED